MQAMSIIGNPGRWPSEFRSVYELIVGAAERAWGACRTRCNERTREDQITRRLVILMKRDPQVRAAPHLPIVSQYELLPDHVLGDVSPKGYLDIAVLFRPEDQELYLAFECKRLNVGSRRRSRAAEYVGRGMLRFVHAQYARELPVGVMIGYVMDGDILFAAAAVRAEIARCALTLLLSNAGCRDVRVPDAFATEHLRPGSTIELRHHLFSLR